MTPQQIDAMKQALEALEAYNKRHRATYLLGGAWDEEITLGDKAITALEEALADHAMREVQRLGQEIEQEPVIDGNTSDGYHTFNELYEFRKAYNIALFNEWSSNGKCSVHKSWRHNDGELCFGGGWFIVVAVLPQGQISNHYKAKDWDFFQIQETEKALFEFDGHTGADVIERLKSYTAPPQRKPKQEPVAYDKTEMNFFVQDLYDKKMQEGKHGHYETMFHVVHQAIKRATPPQRTWVGLTDEDFQPMVQKAMAYYGYKPEHSTLTSGAGFYALVRNIEAKLKEKNT